jgi:pyruvate dehydrogenase E1 component alpha subunit
VVEEELSQQSSGNVLQIISLEGELENGTKPELGSADLLRMYEAMVLTRLLDGRGLNLQRQGRIGFYVPCAGQEAAQVGSSFLLREDDWTFPTYRDLGVAIARGVPTRRIMSHLMANSEDPMLGKQMPNHWGFKEVNFMSVASTIAAHLPVSVGVAISMKMKKKDTVVLSYHGDGATSEGDFHVAYNFAGVNKAPIVFICENNGWAISLPVQKQTASQTLAMKARAYGFLGVTVDGNDVLAVYQATREAVARARRGEGPTMIECLTYRMGPHSTSDDPNRYRTKEEIEFWKKRDPIERFRVYLEKNGIWNLEYENKVRKKSEDEINNAITEEEKVIPPTMSTMFEGVYSEQPWFLKEEQKEEESFSEKE